MQVCKWYQDKKCFIDIPDSVYPCPSEGDLNKCPFESPDGVPLKDTDYCIEKS